MKGWEVEAKYKVFFDGCGGCRGGGGGGLFFQAEDGIRDTELVTGVQTCALPISLSLILPIFPPIIVSLISDAKVREISFILLFPLFFTFSPSERFNE